MIVWGKRLSGGSYPVAATRTRAELRQSLRADSSAQVAPYGGLGTRLRRRARAVLDLTEEPGFLDLVEPVGARFDLCLRDARLHGSPTRAVRGLRPEVRAGRA